MRGSRNRDNSPRPLLKEGKILGVHKCMMIQCGRNSPIIFQISDVLYFSMFLSSIGYCCISKYYIIEAVK